MKKLTTLLLLVMVASAALAQSQQELLKAYRNGTLTQEQIDALRSQHQASGDNVKRTRTVNIEAASTGNNLVETKAELTHVAADPQAGYREELATDIANVSGTGTTRKIFGQGLFRSSQLTFEPNLKIATPKNYVLGAGDEVIIDIWGDAQMAMSQTISSEGRISISGVGPVFLSGLTIEEATVRLRRSLATMYEGLNNGTVKMKLSLGSIRSIQVNIAGEVGAAGTYTLPSLATLFHAMYVARGVNNLGSMRRIQVYRGGNLFSEIDVYDYILNGKTERDIALREGDLITVPAYSKLVEISGQVKRPMFYEMKDNETIADLIKFAGEFTNEANQSVINVTRRQNGGEFMSFTVDSSEFDSFVLEDGDVLTVSGSIDRYENRVQIKGAVYRGGYYAIDDKVKTVKQLIARADGLREDAFMARAMLYREKPDWTMEVQSVDLEALMAGTIADIELRPNDLFVVSSITQMQEEYNVTIFGAVKTPDTYPYAEGMTVEDLVVAANGLLESASTANVTITRRVKDPKSMQVSDKLFEVFTIDLKDGLVVGGDKEFVLQPFDQVYVRRSPVYVTQSTVAVRGEVAFVGNYPLTHRNMRLSEIIAAAGGVTPGAFLEGAYLMRRMTSEESMQARSLYEMIVSQARRAEKDETMTLAGISLQDVYPVGINLEEALAKPGSDADIILRDDDVIFIPQYNGTTRVMGAVLYPNTLTYKEGKSVKHYVKASGGFEDHARKRRTFVINMNGIVESGLRAEVRPGSIIIVPTKPRHENNFDWGDAVQVLTGSGSMTAMMITAINSGK
ncbi:MAG: SLBB domain-containing protein [Alistipes sp.]|nr:SLBB domain-containing protein [Alistipes sp.]